MKTFCINNNCNNTPSLEYRRGPTDPDWAPCCTIHLPSLGNTRDVQVRDITTKELLRDNHRETLLGKARLFCAHRDAQRNIRI